MDPGSVPAELKGLSQTEEMLIARCCPIMRVVHLKGGQLGYGGHVVNVAQDITTFAATLPRLAADVPIIILRREGQEPGQHKDLHVRRVRVQRALIWLIANNPYYRDIVLDDTALSQLPVSPWAHTSDDSYIYQLSLVLATATVSFYLEKYLILG